MPLSESAPASQESAPPSNASSSASLNSFRRLPNDVAKEEMYDKVFIKKLGFQLHVAMLKAHAIQLTSQCDGHQDDVFWYETLREVDLGQIAMNRDEAERQATTIAEQAATIADQGATIAEQGATIADHERRFDELERQFKEERRRTSALEKQLVTLYGHHHRLVQAHSALVASTRADIPRLDALLPDNQALQDADVGGHDGATTASRS